MLSFISKRAFSSLAKPMSPSARAILLQNKYNPDTVQIVGTGRRGLLLKGDVLSFLKNQANPKPQTQIPSAPVFVEQTLSSFANFDQFLRASKTTIPHSYYSCEVDVSEILSLTKGLNQQGAPVSPNAFILKAAGLAQKDSPLLQENTKNNTLFINVVGSTPRGQFISVENCQSKGIERLTQDMQKSPSKAEGLLGGNVSIYSALGTNNDIDQFTEIINYSQCAILTIGKEMTQVVPDALGKPSLAKKVTVTLSVDASKVDSESAAQFLSTFQSYVNSPSTILLSNTI